MIPGVGAVCTCRTRSRVGGDKRPRPGKPRIQVSGRRRKGDKIPRQAEATVVQAQCLELSAALQRAGRCVKARTVAEHTFSPVPAVLAHCHISWPSWPFSWLARAADWCRLVWPFLWLGFACLCSPLPANMPRTPQALSDLAVCPYWLAFTPRKLSLPCSATRPRSFWGPRRSAVLANAPTTRGAEMA